jgi:receptor protein-tyrosine kinase
VELAIWQRESSILADSFRGTLDSILYCGVNGNRPRVIVLTSANPGEGKTTLATNLALALAEIGRRVLLVDGDLRNPRIHQLFRVPNEWGFADLLEGRAVPQSRESIFVQTEYRDLWLLPAGSPPVNVSDALHSARAAEFVHRARHEFDPVLIDTPPISQIPDARVLGRLADGVILVVRAAETMRETAMAAAWRLTEDRTRLLGTILNQWDPSKMARYAPGYYQDRR